MNKIILTSAVCLLTAYANSSAASQKKAMLVDIATTTFRSIKGSQIHAACAESLHKIQEELAYFGLGLKIFEAYNGHPDQTVDSELPMRHARGTAVDVTLIQLTTGEELPMPSDYDDFDGNCKRTGQTTLTQEVFNAILLEDIMNKHGWIACPEAWWHFDFNGWEDFIELGE